MEKDPAGQGEQTASADPLAPAPRHGPTRTREGALSNACAQPRSLSGACASVVRRHVCVLGLVLGEAPYYLENRHQSCTRIETPVLQSRSFWLENRTMPASQRPTVNLRPCTCGVLRSCSACILTCGKKKRG